MTKRAVVIGAGVSGMAASIRLAKKGYRVSLLEKNGFPGGKMGQIVRDGYRWDTGPSLLTLPALLRELATDTPVNFEKSLPIVRLENICRYFYTDGTILNAYSDPKRFAEEAEAKTGTPTVKTLKFLNRNKKLYNLTADLFLFSPFHKISSFLKLKVLEIGLNLHKLGMLSKMHRVNSRYFNSPKLVQLFDRYATYNGSNPYKAPATLNMIAHLEHNTGAFLPAGGMYAVMNYLDELAVHCGVEILYNTPAEEIHISGNRVRAVRTNKGEHTCDVLVNATDVDYFYSHLLKDGRRKAKKPDHYSTSAYIFYWGIDTRVPGLDIHNILFSADYEAEFEHLSRRKGVFTDPTVYIYISSEINQADAPRGGQNLFVMVNAPAMDPQQEMEPADSVRQKVLNKIRSQLGFDPEPHIRVEDIRTPGTIQTLTNSWLGTIYGAASNNPFSAFLRHPNFSRRIGGLYFAGGSVHPGGGIPLCLASAKIVSSLIPDTE